MAEGLRLKSLNVSRASVATAEISGKDHRQEAGVRFGGGLLGIVLSALMSGFPAAFAQEQHGYLMPVVGRVISVDRASGRIVLHHGMLETVDPGDVTCTVPADRLRYIQPGMELSATADTRHRTWRLTDVRRFHVDTPTGSPSSRVAIDGISQQIVSQGLDSRRV
jgi:Cu/Ag efflux protein CusF